MEENKVVLGKKDILKKNILKKKLVFVPEWEGSVWVQEMTAEQRAEFEHWITNSENSKAMRVRMVIHTVVDEDGKLLFEDIDIPDLLKKSGNAIMTISNEALEISGMTKDSTEKIEKNLEAVLKEDSLSNSVEN